MQMQLSTNVVYYTKSRVVVYIYIFFKTNYELLPKLEMKLYQIPQAQ